VKVHVLKPVTSKPGNSEVYVVAECFKTPDDQTLSMLKSHIGLQQFFSHFAKLVLMHIAVILTFCTLCILCKIQFYSFYSKLITDRTVYLIH